MDPTCINWSRRMAGLLSDSDIPTDVTFKFKGSNDSEVSAHGMILAVVCPMFRDMFAQVDNFPHEIIIEDTTAPTFRILIDAIYSVKTIQESLKGKTVDEIFSVLNLVINSNIPELVQAVQDTISSFPLTTDTVLDVAGDVLDVLDDEQYNCGLRFEIYEDIIYEVMDYSASIGRRSSFIPGSTAGVNYWRSSTFQEEAQKLLLACAKFLKNKLTHPLDVFELIAENGDKLEVIHKLAVLVRENFLVPVNKGDISSPPGLMESSGEDTDDEEEDGDSEDSSNYLYYSDEESEEMESDSGDDAVELLPSLEPSLSPQSDDEDLEEALQLLFMLQVD